MQEIHKPRTMANKVTKLANDRTVLIDQLITVLENKVGSAQNALLRSVLSDILDKMDLDDAGNIKNSIGNKRLVALVDNVFSQYAKDHGLDVAAAMVDGVGKITDFNTKYFEAFATPAKLAPIHEQVKESLGGWLGIDGNKVARNGYLDTLIKDPTVKNTIKDMAMKSVVGQAGYQETKKNLGDFIAGDEQAGKTGALKKYYRNFVYDMYSQADRSAGKITADKLGFNYAIYEGGIIETSRKFCRERNGKVFSRAEIEQFDPPEAKQPDYNPFFDLGGYGCRHHLNWIPDSVAFALRPELRDMPATPAEVKQVEEPAPTPAEKIPERPPMKTPFADLADFKHTPYVPSKDRMIDIKAVSQANTKQRVALNKLNDLATAAREKQRQAIATLSPTAKAEVTRQWTDIITAYQKQREVYSIAKKEADTLKQKANDKLRAEITKGLVPGNISVNIDSKTLTGSASFVSKVTQASDFFKKAAAGYLEGEAIGVKALKGNRAYAIGNNISVKKDTPAKTIVHEMAHVLEHNTTVLKAAVDFWDNRTAGQKLLSLRTLNKAYGAGELYKKGGFPNEYDGKVYPSSAAGSYKNIRATEIISRGLEYMYDDPTTFYSKDRDYFNFIYSLFFKR